MATPPKRTIVRQQESVIPPIDPLQLMTNIGLMHFLNQQPDKTLTLTPAQLIAMSKFTVRLEIVDPKNAEESPVKYSLITVDEAQRLANDLRKARGK